MAAEVCWREFGRRWPMTIHVSSTGEGGLTGRLICNQPPESPEVLHFALGKTHQAVMLRRLVSRYREDGAMEFDDVPDLRALSQYGFPIAVEDGTACGAEVEVDGTATFDQLEAPWTWDLTPVIVRETKDVGWKMHRDSDGETFSQTKWESRERYEAREPDAAAPDPPPTDIVQTNRVPTEPVEKPLLEVTPANPKVLLFVPDECRAFLLEHRMWIFYNPTLQQAMRMAWPGAATDAMLPQIAFPGSAVGQRRLLSMGQVTTAAAGGLLLLE